jgi:hypothetical protein
MALKRIAVMERERLATMLTKVLLPFGVMPMGCDPMLRLARV